MTQNQQYFKFLAGLGIRTSFVDKLKITLRVFICPFGDMISKVKDGDVVFDIGCGSGQFCALLNEFARPSFLYGIEIKESLVNNANALFGQMNAADKCHFAVFDGNVLPAELGKADVVFMNDVLHHIPKDRQISFVEAVITAMKPGARFVLKDINRSSPLVYVNKLHDLVFAGEIGREMSFNAAKKLLTRPDTTIIDAWKRVVKVYPHYLLECRKN